MPDGCRLAARLWLPEDAAERPVPAILEYIPYRKRDFTRARDEPMHHYFAGHGYAAVRVDVRGAGDSDGILRDEYLEQEQLDALAVIDWIAAQPWCDGAVGMMGKSWGGFNSLQVAARRPAALRAVISVCSTDDRYSDDAHYMGGCLLNENLVWGAVLMHFNSCPPDPQIRGASWRRMWRARLEQLGLFPALWMEHPTRDAYWRHGSVCEDYAAIDCPVYVIGGWADAYRNAIPRLMAGLQVPRKGLIGPWAHVYPHDGVPGPAIGFLQEALRWWDHWLKQRDTGIMREPMLRVWLQDSVPPQPFYAERAGRWIAEAQWPSARIAPRTWFLNPGRLDDVAQAEQILDWRSPQTTGLAGGDWCGFGLTGEAPIDQRADDGRSLCFDSAPLAEPLEILGAPYVELDISVDQADGLIAVRLNDVAPDGASTRVSYGLLRLSHYLGHERPSPLRPGHTYRIAVRLNDVAHAFAAGHVLRIAISTSYWPIAWPAARRLTLSLISARSRLILPVRPPHAMDERLAPFAEPESAPRLSHTELRSAPFQRRIERDLASNATLYTLYTDGGDFDNTALTRVDDIDLAVGHTIRKQFRIQEEDPLSAHAEVVQKSRFERGDWKVRVESRVQMHSDAEFYYLTANVAAYENDTVFFNREWKQRLVR